MLSCVPEPDLEEATTQLFDVQSYPRSSSTALKQKAEAWVSSGQNWALDHVAGTQFCRVGVCCDTRGLSPHLREFLPLLSEVLLKAPTYDDQGKVISADDNISQLRRRTVSYGCGTGLLGSGTSWGFFVGCKVDRARELQGGLISSVRS